MAKKTNWLWWIVIIVAVVVGWYLWQANKGAISLTNNQTAPSITTPGGVLPMGSSSLDSVIAGIIQEGTQEQSAVEADAGEDALVKSISQQVGDLSQIYDENSY